MQAPYTGDNREWLIAKVLDACESIIVRETNSLLACIFAYPIVVVDKLKTKWVLTHYFFVYIGLNKKEFVKLIIFALYNGFHMRAMSCSHIGRLSSLPFEHKIV
ncbi:hypothetical protein DOS69_00050 [Staphylococcus felis]|nr:hypothetical protein DOS69_00050 [Staphylococcus felis]